MKHTKEPWEVTNVGMTLAGNDYPSVFSRELKCHICTCGDFFGITQVDNKANAERIALCVNACAGIRTEALESGLIKHLLNDAYMRTLNPFDPNPQSKMDMKYLGKPVYEEDFEEVDNGKD